MGDSERYAIRERVPTVEEFQRLRAAAGMAERPRAGVERGLSNSLVAVTATDTAADPTPDESGSAGAADGTVVGMGRVVGDGGAVYHLCDMAVHPDHQGRGVGSRILRALDAFVDDAPSGAYVNLLADVDGFYERAGYEETRPASKGMYRRVE
ncbi:GNAT family N-acetyltransferase [Halobaculum lipolyticum]|uniref:GNAT family N-acetyltransferase n=1 Tax=Halobaculum lipolyticum TaxID=3032001 RepID=A0ABD5W964_9EURY|nr:GNAT family N-acetyltransferase [Halobaculum sp. DT31]